MSSTRLTVFLIVALLVIAGLIAVEPILAAGLNPQAAPAGSQLGARNLARFDAELMPGERRPVTARFDAEPPPRELRPLTPRFDTEPFPSQLRATRARFDNEQSPNIGPAATPRFDDE
jgi:hypothetical protein